MLGETFYELYRQFYSPTQTDHGPRANQLHQELITRLEKEDCVRVLDIIDLKDCYADLLAIDSFTAGFRLAWNITHELHFKEEPL